MPLFAGMVRSKSSFWNGKRTALHSREVHIQKEHLPPPASRRLKQSQLVSIQMSKRKPEPPSLPAPTEAQTQKAIMEYLAAKGVLCFRMNSGAVLASYNGKTRMVRYGVPGMADVLAFPTIFKHDLTIFGKIEGLGYHEQVALWIEVKGPKGVQSDLQKSFQQQVEAHGHRYVLAKSLDDVIAVIG